MKMTHQKRSYILAKINNELVQTVSARELHTFLEVGRDFSTWIKNRLDTLGSQYDRDYLILKGEALLPKTGEQLGISSNKVCKLTNAHNLKTDKYGMYVLDKARGHNRQVEIFRYYENIIPVLKAVLESKEYCGVRHNDER